MTYNQILTGGNRYSNQLIIKNIDVEKNRIIYKYTVRGEWRIFFNLDAEFFIEYNEDISAVPESIAVIPLICNVLPMAWVTNAEIVVPELDKDFYDNVENIKAGYQNMFPNINFQGKLTVKKLIDNPNTGNKAAAFFSGGVDSFATLISHAKEHPTLVTLWGSDIKLSDFEGWRRVKNHAKETAQQFHCDNLFIKSSFRQFLHEGNLTQLVWDKSRDGWWHGFQHGIGIISHVAPLAYLRGFSKVYFASSYTEDLKGNYTCASDPTIDNHLHIGKCVAIHDGYELNRQDKIRLICQYSHLEGIPINLRVCWESAGGRNCCACEKCYRTIFAILAEGEAPEDFGFQYSLQIIEKMRKDFHSFTFLNKLNLYLWVPALEQIKKHPENLKKNPRWTVDLDFSKLYELYSKYLEQR